MLGEDRVEEEDDRFTGCDKEVGPGLRGTVRGRFLGTDSAIASMYSLSLLT